MRLILCRAGLGQKPLRKVEPFGELGDFGAKVGKLVEHIGGETISPRGFLGIPAGDQTVVAIAERSALRP